MYRKYIIYLSKIWFWRRHQTFFKIGRNNDMGAKSTKNCLGCPPKTVWGVHQKLSGVSTKNCLGWKYAFLCCILNSYNLPKRIFTQILIWIFTPSTFLTEKFPTPYRFCMHTRPHLFVKIIHSILLLKPYYYCILLINCKYPNSGTGWLFYRVQLWTEMTHYLWTVLNIYSDVPNKIPPLVKLFGKMMPPLLSGLHFVTNQMMPLPLKGRVYPQIHKNMKYSAFKIIIHPNSL